MPEWGLSVSLGPRIDGVPATDAFGESNGFRRPGYAIAWEPGVTWMKNGWTLAVTVPVAFYRNRIRSHEDKRISAITGREHTGDAAFADYFITASISRRF
jgi:outer membrane receptor for ferrienterochelin and colicin